MIISIVNIIAVLLSPIIAVLITQWLQDRAEKRKDKMQIFKTLMTSRIYGWTIDSVNALNVIDIVFADDENVRSAWKDLYDKYSVENPDNQHLRKVEQAQYKLLLEMANSLGYKVTWETIQNPYIPKGLVQQLNEQHNGKQAYDHVLTSITEMLSNNTNNTKGSNQ